MSPIETLNDEEKRYEEIRKLTTEELQKLASLNMGKEGIAARHELEVRFFNQNQKLTSESIRLTRWNAWLTGGTVVLTIATLAFVATQTIVAIQQGELVKKDYLSKADLSISFVDEKRVASHIYEYKIRVDNNGDRSSDVAYIKFFVPQGVILSVSMDPKIIRKATNPTPEFPFSIYQIYIEQKILVGYPYEIFDVSLEFSNKKPFYEIKYEIAETKMETKRGVLTVTDKDFSSN